MSEMDDYTWGLQDTQQRFIANVEDQMNAMWLEIDEYKKALEQYAKKDWDYGHKAREVLKKWGDYMGEEK